MSENVKVPGGRDNAVLLLEAAEKLDLDPSVVRTTSFGFEVPEEVAKKAGVEIDNSDEEAEKEIEEARKAVESGDSDLSRSGFEEQESTESMEQAQGEQKAPAKKAAAKKSSSKKGS